jgi:hypothetical protein
MAGHALPFVEDLDDRAADADIHLLSDQSERHGVPGAVHLDVVIRRDAGAFPAGERVGHRRQRLQIRPVDRGEEIGPAGTVSAHDAHVQRVHQPPDCGVQLRQREEAPVAQPCVVPQARFQRDDPALRNLHGDFDLRVRHRARTDGASMAHSRGRQGRAGRMAVPQWPAISA